MGLRALPSLERPQEIDNFLLLLSTQLVETFDDLICLAATTPVSSDGGHHTKRQKSYANASRLS